MRARVPAALVALASAGCRDDKLKWKAHLRFQPPKFITLQCLRPSKGDGDLDATCERMAEALAQ